MKVSFSEADGGGGVGKDTPPLPCPGKLMLPISAYSLVNNLSRALSVVY